MRTFEIQSRDGEIYGQWTIETPAAALVQMHHDAGYTDVALGPNNSIVWPDEATKQVCGGLDRWIVQEVNQ